MTAEQLKADGYKVHFTHVRNFPVGKSGWNLQTTRGAMPGVRPSPRGGITFCEIILGDTLVASGEAWCSERDNFCRKLGRDIALGRAVADFTGKTEIRKLRKETNGASS